MLIQIGYELSFDIPAPLNMLLALYTHPEQAHVLRRPERLVLEPDVQVQNYIDHYGNRIAKVLVPAGLLRVSYDNIAQDSGKPEPKIDGERLHPVEELPTECMQFLVASRYCEVDRMLQIAWDLFGNTPFSWERVQAVVDWVHNNVTFGYQYARSTKTAFDVYNERQGVCRDFQHLAITFLRALNIPARYATGYLGDIGVPFNPTPMDFSAWFEVYLGGRWYTLDARHNEPRIGRILQARGRDAVDVALTTSFGPALLNQFTVRTEEIG
ncbi:MAG TPA: transglutaminase family protein [Tepidisphaeraceae bacterium]|jgi:transglutaminase-like putative cysteine protease|nr:transglutaminase family protein [Tepidisphaeraceae bacterium]